MKKNQQIIFGTKSTPRKKAELSMHIVLICFKNGQVYFPFKKWVLSIQAITQAIFMGF